MAGLYQRQLNMEHSGGAMRERFYIRSISNHSGKHLSGHSNKRKGETGKFHPGVSISCVIHQTDLWKAQEVFHSEASPLVGCAQEFLTDVFVKGPVLWKVTFSFFLIIK